MRYKTSYCFTTKELYQDTNPSKWNITNRFAQKHGAIDRFIFCGYVLVYFFYLVFLDMIENNITFEFPRVGTRYATMYIKCFQDEEFRRLYSGGAFLGIDFLKSEFKGYHIIYRWQNGKNYFKEKPVYISHNIKNWFYSKINQGKQYY